MGGRRPLLVLLALLSTALVACSGGDQPTRAAGGGPSTSAGGPTTGPVPSSSTAPKPRYTVATAKESVTRIPIFDEPGGAEPGRSLPNPEPHYGTLRVFLVQEERGEWLHALLPMRPNGTSGWIRRPDVDLSGHNFHMVIELQAHRLTAYDGDNVILQEPIGRGTSATPTPGGLFYTTWLWNAGNQPEYGPYAFGMSGYSEVFYSFGTGDGQFAIHGTDDPSTVGRSVSNGCIRMYNEAITKLAQTLPSAGVPVEIKA
jgi:lipoprotein-anchoring transpeptidase ErfK/SrfK